MPAAHPTRAWTCRGLRASLAVAEPVASPDLDAAQALVSDYVRTLLARTAPEELEPLAHRTVAYEVSPVLAAVVAEGLDAAEWSGGAYNPFGTDWRRIDLHAPNGSRGPALSTRRGPLWRLGSLALALAADWSASGVAEVFGSGVLVAIDRGLAAAGTPPDGGWRVDIGGRALELRSCTAVAHRVGGGWEQIAVAAPSCALATVACEAALCLGDDAPGWLDDRRLPSLLVAPGGGVRTVGGW